MSSSSIRMKELLPQDYPFSFIFLCIEVKMSRSLEMEDEIFWVSVSSYERLPTNNTQERYKFKYHYATEIIIIRDSIYHRSNTSTYYVHSMWQNRLRWGYGPVRIRLNGWAWARGICGEVVMPGPFSDVVLRIPGPLGSEKPSGTLSSHNVHPHLQCGPGHLSPTLPLSDHSARHLDFLLMVQLFLN